MKHNIFLIEYNLTINLFSKAVANYEKVFKLSYHDKNKIYRGICDGMSKRASAKIVKRPVSTITRKIKRNSDEYGYLYPGMLKN